MYSRFKTDSKNYSLIKQGFLASFEAKFKVALQHFFYCFDRLMTQEFLFHIDLTLTVAMIEENCRQYRLE